MEKQITKLTLWLTSTLDWGLLLWIFVLPWQTRYVLHETYVGGEFWEYASLSIYAHEVLAIICILLFLFLEVIRGGISSMYFRMRSALQRPGVTVVRLGIVTAGIIVLTGVWSFAPLITLTRWLHFILGMLLLLVMWQRQISWTKIISILVGAGIIQGYLAIMQFTDQYVLGSSWLGMSEQLPHVRGVSVIQYGTERWLRGYGGLPHPNILGGMLTMIFAVYILLIAKVETIGSNSLRFGKWYIRALFIALIFIVSGIVLSFSRAAWLASMIVLVLAWGMYWKNLVSFALLRRITFISVATALVWVFLFPGPFLARFDGSQTLEAQSFTERRLSYADGVEVQQSYAGIGTGFGAYTHALVQLHPERPLSLNQPLHNSWLLLLNEVGIVGVLLIIFLWARIYIRATFRSVVALVLVPMGLLMLFDHWWVSLVFGNVFFLLLLFLAMVLGGKEDNFQYHTTSGNRVRRFGYLIDSQ